MRRPIFNKVKNIPVVLSLTMLVFSGMAQASHQHHERSRHKSSHSYHYGYFSHYTYPVIHGHHNTHASYLSMYIRGCIIFTTAVATSDTIIIIMLQSMRR